MLTIYFPKYLRSLTNGVEKQNFDTDDCLTLIKGLRTLFPELSTYLAKLDSGHINNICYFMDKNSSKLVHVAANHKIKATTELVLLITLYGQGDDIGGLILGASLIAAGFFLGPQVSAIGIAGILTGSQIITAGIGIVLTSFLSMLQPSQTTAPTAPSDTPIRAQSDSFGSLQNTTSTDTSIPLIFGQMRVPGQFVGGRVRTIMHDASTVISVANYVY